MALFNHVGDYPYQKKGIVFVSRGGSERSLPERSAVGTPPLIYLPYFLREVTANASKCG